MEKIELHMVDEIQESRTVLVFLMKLTLMTIILNASTDYWRQVCGLLHNRVS